MKCSTLPVLCVNGTSATNVAFELLTLSGFRGVTRCNPTRADLLRELHASSPLVVVAEFGLPDLGVHALFDEIRSILPNSTLVVLFDREHERAAHLAGTIHDAAYVSKDSLWTLATVVRHELHKTHDRLDENEQTSRLTQITRALHLLSGINCLVSKLRDRKELLREACHLIVSVGGYAAAVLSSRIPGMPLLRPVVWSSENDAGAEALRTYIDGVGPNSDDVIGRALHGAQELVWSADGSGSSPSPMRDAMHGAGFRVAIALPLLSESSCVGVLMVTSRESVLVSEDELRMLRDVARILTCAIQHMQSDIRVRFLSHHDSQTGLAKRALFRNRLSTLLGKSTTGGERRAVVVMDVERLSLINDSFGRRVGDLLLRDLAMRLRLHLPAENQISHFGGGTFAWSIDLDSNAGCQIVPDACHPAHVIAGEPFRIDAKEIPLSVRTGCAIYPDHGRDADELIRKAEVALRSARGACERHGLYDAGRHSRQIGQLTLEHQLRRAISREEFEMHYQPKVDIATRRLTGLEALIRWQHPDGQIVSPGLFLPVLESTGLIVEVGKWVIERTSRDCQRWLREGLPPVRVAVNIAPAQLRDMSFVPHFLLTVDSWCNQSSGLDVEITEGAFQDECPGDVRKLISLRERGTKIAIDDFGTGYSSLGRIATLPIDVLKIDRSFIGQLNSGLAGSALVKTVINFARAFKTSTVAEGVETQDQLGALWRLGCDQSQGYLHSPPVSADACATMLSRSRQAWQLAATDLCEHASSDDSGIFRNPGLDLPAVQLNVGHSCAR